MENLWPILILWVAAAIFSAARKKRPQPPRAEAAPDEPQPSLLGGLSQALEQLKRAEEEARRKQQGESPRLLQDDAAHAKAYLEQRKQAARGRKKPERKVFLPKEKPARPSRITRAPMPLADDDADKSSETEAVEVLDYDAEAEAVARVRLRPADQGTQRDVSVEGMSEQQAARRSARPAVAIGGVAEHAQWHERQVVDAQTLRTSVPAPRRGVLARFADGSLRGAIVLGEVLGRPVSGR
jgi:hypothetical protein